MLSVAVFFPLLAALALLALRPGDAVVRWAWPAASALEVALVGGLWWFYVTPAPGTLAFDERVAWIPGVNSSYHVGLDGLSLPLVAMTAVVFLACAVYAWADADRARSRAALFLALETLTIGVFAAADLLVFFVFFDLSIVGMYVVIAGWGHGDRQRSALRFFLYTFLGSLALLAGFIGLYLAASPHTFDMVDLVRQNPVVRTRHARCGDPRRDPARARGEDPHRALPHVAAAGPHGRPGDRFRRAGRRVAEARQLRVRADRDADAARCLAVVGVGRHRRRQSCRCWSAGSSRWPRRI